MRDVCGDLSRFQVPLEAITVCLPLTCNGISHSYFTQQRLEGVTIQTYRGFVTLLVKHTTYDKKTFVGTKSLKCRDA